MSPVYNHNQIRASQFHLSASTLSFSGFASSLAGCKSKGSQNGMKKKHIRKCAKKEKILDACGFNCLGLAQI